METCLVYRRMLRATSVTGVSGDSTTSTRTTQWAVCPASVLVCRLSASQPTLAWSRYRVFHNLLFTVSNHRIKCIWLVSSLECITPVCFTFSSDVYRFEILKFYYFFGENFLEINIDFISLFREKILFEMVMSILCIIKPYCTL
jgi:hypothetical protein